MLDRVLKQIDDDLSKSLERLFSLLRIESISTDPAYRNNCANAAEWLASELSGRSVSTPRCARPTGIRWSSAARHDGDGHPHLLFYGHYDVQPVDPLGAVEEPPFEPRIEAANGATAASSAAAPPTTRAS